MPPAERQALAGANRLLAEQEFSEAAGVFEQLSARTEARGMVVRAADLAFQAARARFAAGDVDTAVERATHGLDLLVQGRQLARVPRVLARMTGALRDKGYGAQADELEQHAARALEGMGLSLGDAEAAEPAPAGGSGRRGTLPASCGGCGAPIVPGDVEWHDEVTAACLYCGTVLKTS